MLPLFVRTRQIKRRDSADDSALRWGHSGHGMKNRQALRNGDTEIRLSMGFLTPFLGFQMLTYQVYGVRAAQEPGSALRPLAVAALAVKGPGSWNPCWRIPSTDQEKDAEAWSTSQNGASTKQIRSRELEQPRTPLASGPRLVAWWECVKRERPGAQHKPGLHHQVLPSPLGFL